MNTASSRSDTQRSGSVLVVGVGALGCPALALLARSRIAKLTLIDSDRVELSNLPQQPLYDRADIGRPKALAAAERLRGCGAELEAIVDRLTPANAGNLVESHDYVIDACDDPPTKFLINRVAVKARRPFCYAGVARTGGLALDVAPGTSACLACVFPEPCEQRDDLGTAETFGCHETGIVAPVAAVLGSFQALAALTALGLRTSRVARRLAIYQLRGRRWQLMDFPRSLACPVCAAPATGDSTRRMQSCHS